MIHVTKKFKDKKPSFRNSWYLSTYLTSRWRKHSKTMFTKKKKFLCTYLEVKTVFQKEEILEALSVLFLFLSLSLSLFLLLFRSAPVVLHPLYISHSFPSCYTLFPPPAPFPSLPRRTIVKKKTPHTFDLRAPKKKKKKERAIVA